MNRRDAVKKATLLAIGVSLARPANAEPLKNAVLTVDLDQWSQVVFKHKGKTIYVPVREIFDSLLT